jgi:hypothetical protein
MAIDGSDVQAGGRRRSGPLKGVLAIGIVLLLKVAAPLLLPIATGCADLRVCTGGTRAGRSGVSEPFGAAIVVATVLAVTLLVTSTLIDPASQWWSARPRRWRRCWRNRSAARVAHALRRPPPAQCRPRLGGIVRHPLPTL